jgi:hypothetical protein
MRGERQLLRIGEYLVGRACQRLPQDVREERYREWAAELPAILHDPQIRPAPRRAVRMLAYAADTLRGATATPSRARRPAPQMIMKLYLDYPLLAAGLILVVYYIWTAVRAPGHPLNYLLLAWSFIIMAYPISKLVRSTEHLSTSIVACGLLAGVGVNLWNAAQAPGDWVNYFLAALLFLLLLVMLLVRRWARTRRA